MEKNKVRPKKKGVRGVPDELWLEAKAMAARRGITIGQYVAEALISLNKVFKD